MVENWDDDDRSVCKMPYEYPRNSDCDIYIPITSIITQYYKEENEKLYTTNNQLSESESDYSNGFECPEWDANDSDDSYYGDCRGDFNEDSKISDDEYNSEHSDALFNNTVVNLENNIKDKHKDIVDIIDDSIYKKFSYL